MSTAAIEIKDWSVFRNGRKLVGPLTIRCLPGEAVVITGPSGVGKTSLLHSCLGVSEEGLTAQGIRLEGGALLADKELPRSLAVYIPQAHPFNPNWEVTSFLCRLPWGEWKWWHNVWPETPERRRTVLSVLKRLGLAHRARATVAELSGGEIKRAALAQLYLLRTTAKLFVADEFVNGVDPGMTQSILAECRSIISDTGAAALMAMHDVFAALQIADQIVVLWPVQTNAAPWVLRKGDAAWNPETLHSLLCLSRWAEEHFYLSAESSQTQQRWVPFPFQPGILDAMGDLYIVGKPLLASYSAFRSGHALNNRLLRELLSRPDAWDVVTFADESQAPQGFAQLAPAW